MRQHKKRLAYGRTADVELFRYLRLAYGLTGLKLSRTDKTAYIFGGLDTVGFFFKLHR